MSTENINSKVRLDSWLVKQGFFQSRDRAAEAIKNAQIEVNGRVVTKPALAISDTDVVKILKGDFDFVGRGALKLKAAVEAFGLNINGKICLDIGVATGGFSDFLLQSGAEKVYGVDIGEGQIAPKIKDNPKFVFRNFTDAANLTADDFSENLDLIVVDVSFVSIVKFLPVLPRLLGENSWGVVLIKPQFETEKAHSGVVKDKKLIQKILLKLEKQFMEAGLKIKNSLPSPILGKEGNQEYLWLVKSAKTFN